MAKNKEEHFYDWTVKEMQEAARLLAHDEIYRLEGQRSTRKEKKLVSFGRTPSEKREIKEIIARARLDELQCARKDEDWDKDKEPRIESDSELNTRKKRKLFILPGLALLLTVFFSAFFALKSDPAYAVNIKTEGRSSEFISAETSDSDGQSVSIRAGEDNIPDRGLIVSNMSIGSKDGAFVTVRGRGVVECVIINTTTGNVVSEQKGKDLVNCNTQ